MIEKFLASLLQVAALKGKNLLSKRENSFLKEHAAPSGEKFPCKGSKYCFVSIVSLVKNGGQSVAACLCTLNQA